MLTVAVLGLAGPSAGLASTVSVETPDQLFIGGPISTYTFEAAPRERNDVVVSRSAGRGLLVRDDASLLTAGPGCRSVHDHLAECNGETGRGSISVALGDRNDSARTDVVGTAGGKYGGFGVVVEGGDGDDVITGPFLSVSGGAGNDRIRVDSDIQPPGVTIDGGPGEDVLASNGAAAVMQRDGDGADAIAAPFVSFEQRAAAIVIDLHRRTTSDGDQLFGVRSVIAGNGDDTLRGARFAERLDGGGGNDILRGGRGNDILVSTSGRDALVGGAGDDQISVSGHAAPRRADCGPGRDIASLARSPVSPSSCELRRLDTEDSFLLLKPELSGRTLTFRRQLDPEVVEGIRDGTFSDFELPVEARIIGASVLGRLSLSQRISTDQIRISPRQAAQLRAGRRLQVCSRVLDRICARWDLGRRSDRR